MALRRIVTLGVSLCMIRAKESNGQCHKYSGKLISPNQTIILFESSRRLIQALGPAAISNIVPEI
jgi:hypothetical protein